MTSELPSHSSRVRAAVIDDLPDVSVIAGGNLQELRTVLRGATAHINDVLAAHGDVVVDRYSLPAALRCPASTRRSPLRGRLATRPDRWASVPPNGFYRPGKPRTRR